jgi:hypothetical protein
VLTREAADFFWSISALVRTLLHTDFEHILKEIP